MILERLIAYYKLYSIFYIFSRGGEYYFATGANFSPVIQTLLGFWQIFAKINKISMGVLWIEMSK